MNKNSGIAGSKESATEPRAEGRSPSSQAAGPRQPFLSKTVVNFIVDTILLLFMVSLLFTAAALRFVFPPPTAADGWMLWGFGYDAWANLQFVLVACFGMAVVLHVMLHWAWVCSVLATKLLRGRIARPDEGQQTIWGVGLLIVMINLLGTLLGVAYLTIQSPP